MTRSLLSLVLLPLAIFLAVPIAFAATPGVMMAPTIDVPQPSPTGGLGPLPDEAAVPRQWLPPGAFYPDDGPSSVIYPAQKITIRFNHRWHVQKVGMQCKNCHAGATTSESAQDRILPRPRTCDVCHGSDHGDLARVQAGPKDMGKCGFCHLGYKETDGNQVARMEMPRANMVFNHKKHADINVGCPKCHGDVAQLELATRDQLPRMRGCFDCHQMSDAASQGTAKSNCENCHVRGQVRAGGPPAGMEPAGRMQTIFASGALKPPRWMAGAEHTPDFIERHKFVAGADSALCSNCHTEDYCTACHDGRVRPRSIHPSDYLNMHAIEARMATQKCTSCHREQSFCIGCHQRVGVTMSGPADIRDSGRFHPPKSTWSDPPRKPGHHAYEAEHNLNACVSCHTERDCVTCHGGQGIGGGFDPHRPGFANSCATQYRRNPRPCLVCHEPNAQELAQCR